MFRRLRETHQSARRPAVFSPQLGRRLGAVDELEFSENVQNLRDMQ